MYASVQNVRDLAPFVPINASSQPTEGTVSEWITEIERLTDATLQGIGYTTPITGTTSREIVKAIVTHRVMARIMRARPNPEQDPAAFQSIADTLEKRLRDPNDPLELTDAEATDQPVKESALRVSSNLKEIANEDPVRFATRDMMF